MKLQTLGETLTVAEPRFLTLAHAARAEGRRVDGLIGYDFFSRHVVEIDYARSRIAVHDPAGYVLRPGAVVHPLNLELGWPIVAATVTPRGGEPIPCRFVVDTGVRFTLALYRPFSERHGLYELEGSLHDMVVGVGASGFSRGVVGRMAAISLLGRLVMSPTGSPKCLGVRRQQGCNPLKSSPSAIFRAQAKERS